MEGLYFPVVDGVSGDVDRYGYAKTREEAISLANKHLPMRCPYCGNTDTVEIGDWKAVSIDDNENHADLTEYQCHDWCGRSFWI